MTITHQALGGSHTRAFFPALVAALEKRGARAPLQPLGPPSSLWFFFKKPGGANSQPLLARGGARCRRKAEFKGAGRPSTVPGCRSRSAPSALGKWSLAFFFFLTPRRKTASPKGNGVSCVPHGARGTDIIKSMRFPGSSRRSRWVLIWEGERGEVKAGSHLPASWTCLCCRCSVGPGGHARLVCTRLLWVRDPVSVRCVVCSGLPIARVGAWLKRGSSPLTGGLPSCVTAEGLNLLGRHTFPFSKPHIYIYIFILEMFTVFELQLFHREKGETP